MRVKVMPMAFSRMILKMIKMSLLQDYYTDERGKTYTIGIYGERLYESEDGRRKVAPPDNVKFSDQNEFAAFGWELFRVNIYVRGFNYRMLNHFSSEIEPKIA